MIQSQHLKINLASWIKYFMKFFKLAYVNLDETIYLSLVTILVPCLNFLPGLVIDMYAPSMPKIAQNLNVSADLVKNTITVTIFGYAVGAIILGVLFDILGRKRVIIINLSLFILVSLLGASSTSINELIIVRFIQGLTASAISIGGRITIADHFTGPRLRISILYTSFAFGIGTVIAPFIGGYIQDRFGWQSNFYAFIICGIILLLLHSIFIQERYQRKPQYTLRSFLTIYKTILSHKTFISGVVILIFSQLQIMFYPTIVPFIIERQFGDSATIYGDTALFVGCGYLFGTITNRILLPYMNQNKLLNLGLIILVCASILQLIFALYFQFSLWTLVIPIILICYGVGFLVGNISSTCISLFPNNVGLLNSIQLTIVMLFSSIGNFIVSHLNINTLSDLFWVFLVFVAIQTLVYLSIFRKNIL